MTNKQKLFVANYLSNGLNARLAAEMAGYSKHTAGKIGAENLTKPEIKAAIDEALQKIQSEKICTLEENLELLSSIIRGQITESVVVQSGSKSNFHSELIEKPPSIKDRIAAIGLMSKILKAGENEELASDDVTIVVLPPKNPKI